MRKLLIAATALACVAATQAAADAAPQPDGRISLAMIGRTVSPNYSPRAQTDVLPVQLPRCSPPGATVCVSGWVRVCQCYSFGCHWSPTSYRC